MENYLEEHPDLVEEEEVPDLFGDLDYSGAISEIVDSAVPIYTSEINDTWYLYGDELEEAYEAAGVGDNPRENDGMAAIYYYIEQQVANWYGEKAQGIFEEWKENHPVQVAQGAGTA